MTAEALPCIVCGKALFGHEYEGEHNHPRDAVVCITSGNYGSTVYDSFNGDRLEFNVCDPCLVKAGEQGRIEVGRTQKPISVEGFRVGWTEVNYAPVKWTRELDTSYGENDTLYLSPDEARMFAHRERVHIDMGALERAEKLIEAEDRAAETAD